MRGAIRGRGARWALLTMLALAPVWAPLPDVASADVERHAAYRGAHFPPGATSLTPTAAKPQNKLWWHDGRWWTLQLSAADGTLRVASLRPDHTWGLTAAVVVRRPVSVGDVVADGPEVHVLTRTSDGLVLRLLEFHPDRREYRVVHGRDVVVAGRGSNAAALVMDSRGRLWAAYVQSGQVWVAHSTPSRTRWVAPYPIAGGLGDGELADVVAFDRRVGVMWSDQRRDQLRFAVHRDDRPDTAWSTEAALRGRGMADDHISGLVVGAPGRSGRDTVLFAVKTSLDDQPRAGGDPLVLVLQRAPSGSAASWSRHVVATVDDHWTRPVLTADATGAVHVVARRAADIVMKSAAVDDLAFRPGPGRPVIVGAAASLTDPAVPSQVVDHVCGLLVLASDTQQHQYWHAEVALTAPGAPAGRVCHRRGQAAPTPTDVAATADADRVRISWAVPVSGSWSPADAPPAGRRYLVERDGSRVGTTSATTFVDRPGRAGRHVYRVVTVDESGRSAASAAASVQVRLGAAAALGPLSRSTAGVLALVVELLLAGAAAYLLGRYLVRRRRAAGSHTAPEMVLPSLPLPQGRHARGAAAADSAPAGPPEPSLGVGTRPAGRHRKATSG